ncbi:MAG TPA: selenide, water dikinase SelD [Polyangia bacterium]
MSSSPPIEARKPPLSRLASCGGCAAKMAPGDLQRMVKGLPARAPSPALLVGTETGDDAAVYRLDDHQALVVTTDFITPVCDDPYLYGQVAAANALSDVFAMGGRPLVAVAVCAFPEALDPDDAAAICAGGADKAAEAGAVVAGGHTVRSPELFYGLAVTGHVHPDRVVRNVGARPGDALVLTKPLGTGVLINGFRSGRLEADALAAACRLIAKLNDRAARLMLAHDAHAATDVTGFGLAGHALGMARGSGVALRFFPERFPTYDGVLPLIEAGVRSKGGTTNRQTFEAHVQITGAEPNARELLVYDPQTSGGLLVALPAANATAFLSALHEEGMTAAAQIGEVVAEGGSDRRLQLA